MKERIPELLSVGYTDRMISEELGMSQQWVRKWRNQMEIESNTPNIPKTICKACGVSLLVEGEKKLKGALCMQCHARAGMERRKRKRTAAIELLGNKCADCNQVFPEVCYDFHHTDPNNKDEAIANLVRDNRKLETILNEASKCELLCANCHRLRHFT